jgi:PPP family 3-phenylpropionic acid transporter
LSRAPASLAPFGALSFAYFASIGVFNPYAPLWFQSLGMSTLAIGGVASMQAWTRVVMPYAWSWSGDHWGHGARRVTLLRVAALAVLLCTALLPFTQSAAVVSLVVVLLFAANSGIVPLSEAALAQHLQSGNGGMDMARYGRVRLWGSIGFIASVLLFGQVLQWRGIGWLPGVVVGVALLLALAAWRLPHASATAAPAADAPRPGVWRVLRQPVVAWFFLGVALTVLAHVALYVFFSLYLDALGYGKGAVGALWAVSVVGEIVFFWRQGRWFARWDAHTWLVVAALVTALRFAGIALWAATAWILVALQLLHALSFAAQHAACIALVNRHFQGPLRGRGQALYTTLGYGLPGVVGGVAGAAVVARWGYPAVFWAAAVAALAGAACCARSRALAAN